LSLSALAVSIANILLPTFSLDDMLTYIAECKLNNPDTTLTYLLSHSHQTLDVYGGACSNHAVYADHIVMNVQTGTCFEPVLHGGLDNFYRHHPHGTVLHMVRQVDGWVKSINGYNGLGRRFKQICKQPGYFATHWANKTVTDTDLAQFYMDHLQAVRDFAVSHPSLLYIELSLATQDTGAMLEIYTGIPSRCWGNKNANKHRKRHEAK
jgi:hypothetical protein